MSFLIGHLIGDYVLQNNWMARNKKNKGDEGYVACFVHCLLYTCAVMACTGWWHAVSYTGHVRHLWAAVFLSHFLFDRTGICKWWMKIMGSWVRPGETFGEKLMFFPIVYVGLDNTCHLVLLWLIAKYLVIGA